MAQRSKLPLLLAGLVSAGLLTVLGLALFATGPTPTVTVTPEIKVVGRKSEVTVEAREPRRGLSALRVELVQGARTFELVNLQHAPRAPWSFGGQHTPEARIAVELGKEKLAELESGEATLRVTAEGAGSWLRRPAPATLTLPLTVRFTPPTLAVGSIQNNVAQGGCEVVVYTVGPGASRHGVEAGEWFFPGYPLPGGAPGQSFALYAAPYDLDDPGRIRLVAEDDAGNRNQRAFVDRFTARPVRPATIQVDDAFLARVVPEILANSPEVKEQATLLDSYLVVNRELRKLNNARLRALAGRSEPKFLWNETFRQLPGSAVMASFADRRTYLYQGKAIDQQDHLGFDLASNRQAPVAAANRGKVLFAGYLGIYGNTVVLDHGYGLGSLYSHLTRLDVKEGDSVAPGASLGTTGVTGLAGGDHLHFSMLLHGLPVNPVEWWDGGWIRAHLKEKLGAALPFAP